MPQLAFLRSGLPKIVWGYAIHDGPEASWSGGPSPMRIAWGDGWVDGFLDVHSRLFDVLTATSGHKYIKRGQED